MSDADLAAIAANIDSLREQLRKVVAKRSRERPEEAKGDNIIRKIRRRSGSVPDCQHLRKDLVRMVPSGHYYDKDGGWFCDECEQNGEGESMHCQSCDRYDRCNDCDDDPDFL